MAISGVNTYNNAYENVYATKQKEETKETSAAQKKRIPKIKAVC